MTGPTDGRCLRQTTAVQTRFTELIGCRWPLQQAGMGAVTTADLVVAVCDAGALGTLAGVWDVETVRARTDRPFAVNFLMPFLDRDAVEAASTRARVVEFFYGDPDDALVALVHDGGALAAWQVGSADEARAAADAGCDVVIAQGEEAGGHVRGTTGLLPLLDAVLDAVDVPVVAAGGLGTARSVKAVLAAGADGARVGTRFVAAEEADAHPQYVAALVAAGPEDTELTTAFSAFWPDAPHRVLRDCIAAGGDTPPSDRSPMPPARNAALPIDAMALYAGESVGAVTQVQPAAAIVDELVAGLS